MKFMFTEPEQNVFNFTGADEFLAIVQATDKLVRCHNCKRIYLSDEYRNANP